MPKLVWRFVAISCLLAWSLWICVPYIGNQGVDIRWLGKAITVSWRSVFFVMGGMAPGIAAMVLSRLTEHGGQDGSTRREKNASRYKILAWCVTAFFIPILVFGLVTAIFDAPELRVLKGVAPILFFLLNLPLSSFWEEYGWRGYLLPRLEQQYSPVKASFFIGVVWGLWHLPKQLLFAPFSKSLVEIIAIFLIQILALAFVLTWIYNASGGRLLPATIFHGSLNAMTHFLITPVMAHVGIVAYIVPTALFVALAAGIVYFSDGALALAPARSAHPTSTT